MAKDDATHKEKVALRRVLMRHVKEPVIMETHGGLGQLWAACYSNVLHGIVFDKRADRAAHLARQRPTWAVYKADCEAALSAGVGGHLMVNVLDVDPYGNPWPTLQAFFESERPRAKKLYVVVNDGLRVKLKLGGGWNVKAMRDVVEKYGNRNIHSIYLKICQELLEGHAAKASYRVTAWTGYYCGHAKGNTHYLAELERG